MRYRLLLLKLIRERFLYTTPTMTHLFRVAVLALILPPFLSGCINSEPSGAPSTGNPPDPFAVNRALGQGVNLGNALEAPSEGEWGMVIEEEHLELIRDAGFTSVRIPIRWNAHAHEAAPYTIDRAFFGRVDEVVGWALEHGLLAIIDFHHYNELMETPAAHRSRFLALWQQIAEHYRDYPVSVLFEVLNEPHRNLTPELWNEYLRDAIEVIRRSNADRTLIVGTADWGGFGALPHLSIPVDDRNIIVTVHYYNPFRFTHQGASWAGAEAQGWLGTTWTGTDEERAAVDRDFDTVREWARAHDRPIYVGEFGAYGAAPMASRERWTAYVRQASEARGFSWGYWEFGAGFGVYDRQTGQWRRGLLEALLPDSPELDELSAGRSGHGQTPTGFDHAA
jgi:endoglucanase